MGDTAMLRTHITIEPQAFTRKQWVEFANLQTGVNENYETARKIKRAPRRVVRLLKACEEKTLKVRAGFYGNSDGAVDIGAWGNDLCAVSDHLRMLLQAGEFCAGCGRPEDECSKDPCPDVIMDRDDTEDTEEQEIAAFALVRRLAKMPTTERNPKLRALIYEAIEIVGAKR